MNTNGQNLKCNTDKREELWCQDGGVLGTVSPLRFKLIKMSSLKKNNGYVVILLNVKKMKTEKKTVVFCSWGWLVLRDLREQWEEVRSRVRKQVLSSVSTLTSLANYASHLATLSAFWASDPRLIKRQSQHLSYYLLGFILRVCYGLNCVPPECIGWSPKRR